MTHTRSYFTLIFLVLLSTLFVWLPFLLHSNSWIGLQIPSSDMSYLYGNFDGPLYIIPAKTLYDPNKIDIPGKGLIISLPLTKEYFAAHLPVFPFAIRIFAPLFGYPYSMLFVTLVSTIFLVIVFYELLRRFELTSRPMVLASVFLFLPRFLAVRTIGAPETMFILFVLLSLLFFEKKRYFLAGLAGFAAAATKTPGVLLFFAYAAVVAEKFFSHRIKKSENWFAIGYYWLLLIPAGLLTVFLFYKLQYGDFFAYFHTGGVVPMPYPFSALNSAAKWVGSAWLEDIIFYYILYLTALFSVINIKQRSIFYFLFFFFIAALFVQHRDIARYTLPIWPIACIAHEKFFTSRKFIIVLALLMPAIYLYTWDFLIYNKMPIGDWSPYF